jgi:molybdate transport system ATP-binding protein
MANILFSYLDVSIKNYGHTVFTHFDFTIHKGQQWAFTGNGPSGIPLLMQAMAGKTLVTGGSVVKAQSVVLVSTTSHFKNRSNTGDFYFQQRFNSTEAGDAQTVSDYLSAIMPLTENPHWTIAKTLQRLRLDALADKPIIMLSNGETRKLLLAEALIKSPALLLLDNPFAGLDVASRADLNLLLDEIIASGMHIVVAAAPNEIPPSVTHVAVFEDAKLVGEMPSGEFKPEEYSFSEDSTLDLDLLQKLIENWQQPKFENIISMKNVTIKYGEKTILNNINWQVNPGECWAIQGHNGSGKSTLLSLINGDNPQAYANDITLFGKKRGSGESIWDIKKKIGFVSADLPKFFPNDQSCAQIIESGLYDTMGLFRKPKEENREAITGWMALFGIENFAAKNFATAPLSVQRLCLAARAFIKMPPLLILDEPTQGLDTMQINLLKHIITYICENTGCTLLYVSHYAQEIPPCVTRTLALQNGVATLQ